MKSISVGIVIFVFSFSYVMIESSEVSFFLKDLTAHISSTKAEDPVACAKNYFQQVSSGSHVIGTDYCYVIESNHNRKSLVYCLIKAFKNFPDNTELTAIEFYLLIESVVSNFPKSIVMESLMSIENMVPGSPNSVSSKYQFKDIALAVYTQILYDEWLKLMEEFFKEENTLNFVSIYRIKAQMEDLQNNYSTSIFQPSMASVNSAMESTTAATSPDGDMTYDQFRKCLFTSKALAYELYSVVSIVNAANYVRPHVAEVADP